MYAARASLRALAIAGESTVSQVTVTDLIENYPGIPEGINGFDLAERLKTQAVQFGLQTASGDVTAVVKKRGATGTAGRSPPAGCATGRLP